MIAERERVRADHGFSGAGDARAHERRPASCGMARLRWAGRGGVHSCPALLLDLGRGGALALALAAPEHGAVVDLRLVRPGSGGWIEATVVGREPGDVRGRVAEAGVSTLRLAFAGPCPDAFLDAATADLAG